MSEPIIYANLLHLSYNMWGDWENHSVKGKFWAAKPELRFDETLWNDLLKEMSRRGMNMVVIDLGDGIQYASHPEIAVKNAWTRERLRKELKRLRDAGLEPIPKLNFSTCHDYWLGEYARMVSTPKYYEVVANLIREVTEIFDRPRLFHLGMDEETAPHQVWHEHVVVRQHGLWWRDLRFQLDQLPPGTRPWVWADYVWNHPDAFWANMPASVLQSNWYYGASFDESIGYVKAYRDLEAHGYDQIPAGSPWEVNTNFPDTVRHCSQWIAPQRLKGFLQTAWRPTLQVVRDRHLEAVREVAEARRWFEQNR